MDDNEQFASCNDPSTAILSWPQEACLPFKSDIKDEMVVSVRYFGQKWTLSKTLGNAYGYKSLSEG